VGATATKCDCLPGESELIRKEGGEELGAAAHDFRVTLLKINKEMGENANFNRRVRSARS